MVYSVLIKTCRVEVNGEMFMKCIVEGHRYLLDNFEDKTAPAQLLQFIHKEPVEGSTGEMRTKDDGTTNEEVLEMLIDRMKYLQAKFPCKENACCITHLEEGLMWLHKRTRDRQKRGVEGKHQA
jgi:hypothetical protein